MNASGSCVQEGSATEDKLPSKAWLSHPGCNRSSLYPSTLQCFTIRRFETFETDFSPLCNLLKLFFFQCNTLKHLGLVLFPSLYDISGAQLESQPNSLVHKDPRGKKLYEKPY